MVEVMVAVVVTSIGVLALAGLQLVTKRNTLDAAQRAAAAELANDLIERIRHNAVADGIAVYTDAGAGLLLGGGTMEDVAITDCSASAGCTPAQLAAADLKTWEALLDGAAESGSSGLMNGRACITPLVPAGSGDLIRITLVWRSTVELPDSEEDEADECVRDTDLYGDGNLLRRTYRIETYITQRGVIS
jgi:type IV pilus assembly protein PilV